MPGLAREIDLRSFNSKWLSCGFDTLPSFLFCERNLHLFASRPKVYSALTTASAELKWRNGWSAAATFEGEFSDVTRSYAGKGVVRYAW
jgi:hypothetical protein